ncbi:MAG: peptidase M48 [Gemmatimonadetes bacterium]|nr:peptidase M48 [Gemmatimonadota bacterium]
MRRLSVVPYILVALAAAGCATNPATGASQLMLVSEAQEIKMGRQTELEVAATIGMYPDAELQRYIQQLGSDVAATSERPKLPWTFRVVDDAGVNAFAAPGGFIFVTRGILSRLGSEAELVGVLGHEIGHVTARHTAAEMSKQQLLGAGLAVGSVVSSQVASVAGLASQGLGVLFLKFSRDNESQADQLGLRYMRKADYDPRELPKIFVMLGRESEIGSSGGKVPEWLATHPNPENRLEQINQQIAALPKDYFGMVINRDVYERRLAGLVFGNNPRQGYFKDNRFIHPELRFRLTFPEGWATNNGAQAVTAVSPGKDAAVELMQTRETSADAAARAFLSQQGIMSGAPVRTSVSGLAAVGAPFSVPAESGALRGTVLFVEYRGTVYRIVAYAPETRWPGHQAVAERALRSFEELTDQAALGVQPHRVEIVSVDRRTTISEMAQRRASPATPATLALINQVELETPLEAGRLVKWVVGQPLP